MRLGHKSSRALQRRLPSNTWRSIVIDEPTLFATALVHSTPGAAMEVIVEGDRRLAIGRHPSAGVDPCNWRRSVIAARSSAGRVMRGPVRLVGFGGSLRRSAAGGWFGAVTPNRRLLATTLVDEHQLSTLLSGADLGSVKAEHVAATLRPDTELGVTTIEVSVEGSWELIDDVATRLQASLLVAELADSLSPTSG